MPRALKYGEVMKIEDYRKNPCGSSSLNWHKTKNFVVPNNIRVVHHLEHPREMGGVKYFRLLHDLKKVGEVKLPIGYECKNIDYEDEGELTKLSAMIESAYMSERLPLSQMRTMIDSPLFDSSLWIAILDEKGEIVASAISEYDASVPECSLDWFQVSESHRGLGLGSALVLETLNRVKGRALFATVTGTNIDAEMMYRSCGFTGEDYWYILAK